MWFITLGWMEQGFITWEWQVLWVGEIGVLERKEYWRIRSGHGRHPLFPSREAGWVGDLGDELQYVSLSVSLGLK